MSIALMFYAIIASDPTVPLAPVSAIMHFADDAAGQKLCNSTRDGLNAELKRQGYLKRDTGLFVCRPLTTHEIFHYEPGMADRLPPEYRSP
jgi:hypothetical protein